MGNTVKYPVTTLLKEGDYFDIPVKKKLGGMRRNMPFKVVTKWLEDGSALRVTRGADVYGS
jgi:hypothetical protein